VIIEKYFIIYILIVFYLYYQRRILKMSAKYSYRNETPNPYYYPFVHSQNDTPLTNHVVLDARLAKYQI
jgi:hypothetical protein